MVTDWKTNWTMPETVEKNLQLRIYGWALKRAVYCDVEEILLRLHFLRFGANRQVLLTSDELAGVPAELDAMIARIEADTKFEPTPGSFCGWCGVTAHCPEAAKALVPVEIMHPVNHEDAVEAAKLLLAMQAMAHAIKEHLKTYVGVNGPIVVGDMVYGPFTTASYDLDPKKVTGYLLDRGVDREAVWGVLNLSKDSLEKGLKKAGFKRQRKRERDELMRDILAMAPIIEEENIGFRKIKAENQPVEQAEAA
ncbi:MAG: PD-(D/E)XK nuclease family protein [Syntrophales bacterium]